jgi:glutathione S-transferase
MKLHWSPKSPFVRKVMIVIHECGLSDQVELQRSVVASQLPPNENVLRDSPLGKIPVLVTNEGLALPDSRVITEYLNDYSNSNLFPSRPDEKVKQLRWQALADGLTDVLLLWRIELSREETPWAGLTDGWLMKVRRTMQLLDHESQELRAEDFAIGQVSVVCALGQLDFRWPDCDWRRHFPALANASSYWNQRDSVRMTEVQNDSLEDSGALTKGILTF